MGLWVGEKKVGAEKGVATILEGAGGEERGYTAGRTSVRSSAMIDDFRSSSFRPGGKHYTVRLAIPRGGSFSFRSIQLFRLGPTLAAEKRRSNERKYVRPVFELSEFYRSLHLEIFFSFGSSVRSGAHLINLENREMSRKTEVKF